MAVTYILGLTSIIAVLSGVSSFSAKIPSVNWNEEQISNTDQSVPAKAIVVNPDEQVADSANEKYLGSWSDTWKSCSEYGDGELPKNASVACHGVKIVRRILTQLLNAPGNLDIGDGIQLVRIPVEESTGRGMWQQAPDMFTKVKKFLWSHELRIKIPELLSSGEEWTNFLQQLGIKKDLSSARKKDKGSGHMMLAMGLMMKGMMTAMGMGGLGLLAMKALMVSGLALMLSAIVGVKSMSSGEDHHSGSHVVSVVPHSSEHGHYRRKRSDGISLAYRGHVNP